MQIYSDDTSANFGNVLEIGKWIHLAVAMDSTGNVTAYKDGSIIGEKKFHLPRNLVRNQNYLGKSNWSIDPLFNGKMDEVRIWKRCLSQSEIQATLHHRLVGDEPGLWAYYRFDEGFGNRLHDQTENAIHATIQGATWVKSDAPIGDHPGLQRTSFSLKSGSDERQIASGLASVLYHQQEKVATGYDQQEKPVKRNTRVMLTVATSGSTTTDKNFIAALDFAVSREGKLAQAPDCLTLPNLQTGNEVNQDLDTVSRLQEEIETLKVSINRLEVEIQKLPPLLAEIERLMIDRQNAEAELNAAVAALAAQGVRAVPVALVNKRNLIDLKINELVRDRETLKEKSSQLVLLKDQLPTKEAELEFARSRVQGEISLPMSWLHTDPCGLTVAGGLLKFAYAKDTPLLVNSATGNVALYFRGMDDQFFVAYYDTNTTKAQYLLGANTGKLIATARSAEPECDRATFTISDSDTPETCTLKITNSATKLEETWCNLPRTVEQFCNILNGEVTEPVFIGKLEQSVDGGNINSLILSQKTQHSLAKGSILSLGNKKVVVSADVKATDKTVSLTPVSLKVPAGAAVYLIPYDYDTWATNNRTCKSLNQGSLQFIFQPGSSNGKVQNGVVTGDQTTLSCQWVAESPGRALSFDGKDDYVKLADSAKLSKFDAKGDLTLEAWVRSAQLAESSRVIHHHSVDSQYTLGVQSIVTSVIQDKQIYGFAGVGNLFFRSKELVPMSQWCHLSAVYSQSYALQFKGNGFLECNHNPTLDLDRDLSIRLNRK